MEVSQKEGFSEEELWHRYLNVTRELLKYINEEEIDLFLDLVDQRQRLMEMMQAIAEPVFAKTRECDAIREQIKPLDMQIMYKARTWLNRSKRNNMAVRSYDITSFAPAGNVFNKGY